MNEDLDESQYEIKGIFDTVDTEHPGFRGHERYSSQNVVYYCCCDKTSHSIELAINNTENKETAVSWKRLTEMARDIGWRIRSHWR